MNENINLVEILKDCKEGTKFYSPAYGDLILKSVYTTVCLNGYPIVFTMPDRPDVRYMFTKDGRCCKNGNGECCIFPSRDQRDWSKFKTFVKRFDPENFKPFDKVLVRSYRDWDWVANIVSHYRSCAQEVITIGNMLYTQDIIPYNEETHTLIGTNTDCPNFYKWWENNE